MEKESVQEWIEEVGWDHDEAAGLQAEGTLVWGLARNRQPLVEEEVRMLHSARTWKPHILAT